jgi:hypothetical protein
VAEQDPVQLRGQRQRAERRGALGAEVGRVGERRDAGHVVGVGHGRLGRARDLGDLPLAVAGHPLLRRVQRRQPIQHRTRERAGDRVAADHDRIGAGRARVSQHRVERLDVPVDVVEGEDAHGPTL